MKTKLLLAVIFLISFQMITSSQPCLPGFTEFTTQAQIDNFQSDYPGCTEIVGDLYISGTDITNLNGLSVLTYIAGTLLIYGNWSLTSLTGLEGLTNIGGHLNIGENGIGSLEGLDNLTSVGENLGIDANYNLTSLTGLNNLTSIGADFWVQSNNALSSLTGLESLVSIGGQLTISQESFLTSLAGLDNLTSIGGDLYIYDNGSLTSLAGLDNIDTASIVNLSITYNPSLSTCEVQSICNYLASPNGTVEIYKNAQGCNNPPEVATGCGISIPCLPYGDYYFLSQEDIDNFQSNYPGCMDINGNVIIEDPDYNIINLNGLNELTSIGNDLTINSCTFLTSLTGLNNLTSIGGGLQISSNSNLISLSSLLNLSSIGGNLRIINNDALTSLTGLDNIAASSISSLEIRLNALLSTCEIKSICDYLALPTAYIEIEHNDTGCDNPEEVEEACELIGIDEIQSKMGLNIYPNPSFDHITLNFTLNESSDVKLEVLNNFGQVVAVMNKSFPEGEQRLIWNTEGLPAGVYFYRLAAIPAFTGTGGKLVVVR